MRWLALLLLLAGPAHALDISAYQQPVIDLDFTRSDKPPPNVTVSRAASVTGFNCASPRALVTFGPNVAATHLCDEAGHSLGLAVNQGRIFQSGWARDLTQEPTSFVQGWAPTNTMAALDQTGIDLVANSASSVTATANGGTICQSSINTPPQYRVLTAYMKRLSGTGAVWITQDGTNWTEVDGLINSSGYTRVPRGGLLQSVNNPSLCFRLDASGDKIAVDYVNLENDVNLTLSGPTTPVLTTTSSFNIFPADVITVPLAGVTVDNFTIVMKFNRPRWYGQAPIGGSGWLFEINDGTTQNTLQAYMQTTALTDLSNDDYATNAYYNGFTGGPKTRCSSVPASQLSYLAPPFPGQFSVVAVGYSTIGGLGITCNNGSGLGSTPDTPIPGPTLIPAGTLNTLVLGYSTALTNGLSGYISGVQVYNGRLSTGSLTSILARLNPAVPARVPSYLLLKGGGKFLFSPGGSQPAAGPMQCDGC